MSNEIYPQLKGLSFPVVKEYGWKTLRVYEHPTGADKSFISQIYPSYISFKLTYNYLDSLGMDDNSCRVLVGFFNARRSGYDDFLFDDPSFNYMENQQIGKGDGVKKQFQIVANYGEGLIPIFGQMNGQPHVFINGTEILKFSITDYGLLILDEVPAVDAIITITSFFFHRVKFNIDTFSSSENMYGFSDGEVTLKTFKPTTAGNINSINYNYN